jgi:alpha-D-xyloside xylohydrolase
MMTMPDDGEYEIGAEGDDGVRVWLDGKIVVDDWGRHGMRWRGQKLSFTQGQKVAVKIEYYQGNGDRGLRLGWKTPSQFASEATTKPKVDNVVETYLPTGAEWYDFWTNTRFSGGQPVKQEVPINQLPLFVRAGSIVPMGPVVQYATEKPDAPYEIRIYPGADASFTLYEDDNETYDYERGKHATTELKWNDKARKLTIGKQRGEFAGMTKERDFHVVFVSPTRGAGIALEPNPQTSIHYTGHAITLSPEKLDQ